MNLDPHPAKPCVITYLPPPSFGCATAFHQNLTSFKTHYPLLVYSEDQSWPAAIKLRASPEFMKGSMYPNNTVNPWATNNLIFWTGVAIALDHGYTHMIYLESDCRMRGDGWDKVMFDEFDGAITGNSLGKLMGGSALCYSPCNRLIEGDPSAGRRFARKWQHFMHHYAHHQFPIPAYGGGGASEMKEQIVMINGALGVYDLAWLKTIGPKIREKTAEFCAQTTAWDYYLGRKLVEKYGESAFDYVAHLDCVYSGYGDVMFTEAERIKLLTDGRVVGVHQVKSNWTLAKEEIFRSTPPPDLSPLFETPDGGNRPPIESSPARLVGVESDGGVNEAPTAKADAAPAGSGASSSVVNPRVSIFIVTHAKDFEWLGYCLQSIAKFATGFHRVVVVCPDGDEEHIYKGHGPFADSVVIKTFDQAPAPLGHLHHNYVKCTPYEYDLDADYFLYVDSDCVFTGPVTPADYFVDGKPVLLIESYESLAKKKDGAVVWQKPAEDALDFRCRYETMRRHPAVHGAAFLMEMRKYIEAVHGRPLLKYVLDQKPTYPCGFAEFPTMGAYALHVWSDLYHFIDVGEHPDQRPPDNIMQFWSHGPIDKPQDIWHGGKLLKDIVPIVEIKRILGL